MEKVSFQPLIELLQENADTLNQTLSAASSVSRRFSSSDISTWFVAVVEPVFEAVHQHDQTRSRKVFDILFRDMLNILAQNSPDSDLELQINCRLLLRFNPALAAANSARILGALTTAFKKLCRHSHAAAAAWIELMQQIVPLLADVDQLLAAGRLAAWRCGMAHLRGRTDSAASLDQKIVSIIFGEDRPAAEQLQQRWQASSKPVAMAAGGFCGFGGQFLRPPRVALHDGVVFVSDDAQTRVLFADRFGHVLLECADLFKDSVDFALKPMPSASLPAAKILARYKDLTSWVHHDSTLYLTTRSSHAVFLFGAVDG